MLTSEILQKNIINQCQRITKNSIEDDNVDNKDYLNE